MTYDDLRAEYDRVCVVDYRALLQKYIQHVFDNEGTTFIGRRCRGPRGFEVLPGFTDAEVAVLLEMDKKAS